MDIHYKLIERGGGPRPHDYAASESGASSVGAGVHHDDGDEGLSVVMLHGFNGSEFNFR